MLFAAVLSVAANLGSFGWLVSVRDVLVDVAFCQFSINPLNSTFVADAMTFLIIIHYTCTGTFYGGIYFIGVLYFFLGKRVHLIYFVPLVLICRIHPNIFG